MKKCLWCTKKSNELHKPFCSKVCRVYHANAHKILVSATRQKHKVERTYTGLHTKCAKCRVIQKLHPITFCSDVCRLLYKSRAKENVRRRQQLSVGIKSPPDIDHYNKMVIATKGICPCCRRRNKSRWHLHHNHKNGKWIGIVCSRCNCAFGLFGDSLNVMIRAVEWFSKYHKRGMKLRFTKK